MHISHIITEQSLPVILWPTCIRTPTQPPAPVQFFNNDEKLQFARSFWKGRKKGAVGVK